MAPNPTQEVTSKETNKQYTRHEIEKLFGPPRKSGKKRRGQGSRHASQSEPTLLPKKEPKTSTSDEEVFLPFLPSTPEERAKAHPALLFAPGQPRNEAYATKSSSSEDSIPVPPDFNVDLHELWFGDSPPTTYVSESALPWVGYFPRVVVTCSPAAPQIDHKDAFTNTVGDNVMPILEKQMETQPAPREKVGVAEHNGRMKQQFWNDLHQLDQLIKSHQQLKLNN